MVLIEFQFPSHDGGLSLDKYLGADVWSQIYEKLQSAFEAYRQHNASDALADDTHTLKRAQLEMKTSWKSARSYHKDILRKLDGKGDDSFADVLMVRVGMISALDKYKKLHGYEKKTEKRSTESADSEPSAAKENRSSNGSTTQVHEEYVPEPLTDILRSLNYTPSTLSNSNENMVISPIGVHPECSEYEPSLVKNGNNDSQVITYTPTKISATVSKAAKLRADASRPGVVVKKDKMMKTIFGGDSGDDHDSDGDKSEPRRLRLTSKSSQIDTNKPKEVQLNLNKWINTNRITKRTDTARNGDRADDKKKIRKIAADEQPKREHKTEDEKMRELAEYFEKAEKLKESAVVRTM